MASNYLYAGRPDPFQSLLQGFGAGQDIMSNISRNQLLQEQAQKTRLLTAIKIHDELKGNAYGNLEFYNNTYRPMLIKQGVPEGLLPEYKTVEDLNQGLYRNEQIKAMYKQKMEGGKVVPQGGSVFYGGNFMYPEVSPTTRAMLEQKRLEEEGRINRPLTKFELDKQLEGIRQDNRIGLIKERADKAPKEWKPDLVEMEDGSWGYADPRTATVKPLPGIKGKAKAGQDAEIRLKALTILGNSGILPGDEGYDQKFNGIINSLTGKKQKPDDVYEALNPKIKLGEKDTGEIRIHNGRKYRVIIRNGVKGIDPDNPLDE